MNWFKRLPKWGRLLIGIGIPVVIALLLVFVLPTTPKIEYEPLPTQYLCWINISEPSFNVTRGDYFQVPITLTIPIDADYNGTKLWEVRILIEDTTQTGIVQIALESRWFIIATSYQGNFSDTRTVYEGDRAIPALETGFGLCGARINFDSVFKGWSGTVPLIINNGHDRDRLFVLSVVSPSKS